MSPRPHSPDRRNLRVSGGGPRATRLFAIHYPADYLGDTIESLVIALRSGLTVELVYALTPFEALCGFRAPRQSAKLLSGLDAPLAKQLHALLTAQPLLHRPFGSRLRSSTEPPGSSPLSMRGSLT